MLGRKPNYSPDPQESRRGAFTRNALSAASLIAVATLILIAPDFYHYTNDLVWSFLQARYPPQLLPIAFFGVYAVMYPAMFFLARASWTTSAGMAVLWLADKIA